MGRTELRGGSTRTIVGAVTNGRALPDQQFTCPGYSTAHHAHPTTTARTGTASGTRTAAHAPVGCRAAAADGPRGRVRHRFGLDVAHRTTFGASRFRAPPAGSQRRSGSPRRIDTSRVGVARPHRTTVDRTR